MIDRWQVLASVRQHKRQRLEWRRTLAGVRFTKAHKHRHDHAKRHLLDRAVFMSLEFWLLFGHHRHGMHGGHE